MSTLQEIPWLDEAATDENEKTVHQARTGQSRYNLLRISWMHPLLISRWPQFIIRAQVLAGFVFTITAGLIGTRVGSHNFATSSSG